MTAHQGGGTSILYTTARLRSPDFPRIGCKWMLSGVHIRAIAPAIFSAFARALSMRGDALAALRSGALRSA